jgi:hypothetical protein
MILNFVVNGNYCVVHAHPADALREIVDIALKCTRYTRANLQWEVRDHEGRLLDESIVVSDLAYTSGTDKRIYVSPRAGVGA